MLRKFFYYLMYLRRPPWDSGVTPPEVLDFSSTNTPGRALDLGCGTGTNAITLAQQGWEVTGIDFVGKVIREGKLKARQAGVKVNLISGDVTNLDHLTTPFDLVLDIGCFHSLNLKQRKRYMEHIKRLLNPGGAFLLYAFINMEGSEQAIGLNEQDIKTITSYFIVEKKQIGSDRDRTSAWFTFRQPMSTTT
jgi:cyclopropane fatty-acyl-phospholipid synthase-like methyltransferase